MRKKRLLFPIIVNSGWIGGVYYMRNIIYSALRNPEIKAKYDLIIIVMEENAPIFECFKSEAKIVVVSNKNKWKKRFLRIVHFLKADQIYNHKHDAKDIFHLFDRKGIYWIADLQETHYPQFFEQEEINQRVTRNTEIANSKRPLVLSSESSKQDFIHNYPQKATQEISVVHFASAIEEEALAIQRHGCAETLRKYGIDQPYVFIANQFWQHKNHLVIFQMLALAKEKNLFQDVKFVFTGHLKDYRNPAYFEKLTTLVEVNKLDDQIKILGFIPREDQLAIMSGARFLIQPSLFEGWGTVVEDGKVLDKTIVLSDIPVHREQMNDKCVLFDPESASDLLSKIETMLTTVIEDKIDNGIANLYQDADRYGRQLKEVILK